MYLSVPEALGAPTVCVCVFSDAGSSQTVSKEHSYYHGNQVFPGWELLLAHGCHGNWTLLIHHIGLKCCVSITYI